MTQPLDKDFIIHTENPALFLDSVKKYEKRLLRTKDHNSYIDEMILIVEKNKIAFHNDFLLARIVQNVDFNKIESGKKVVLAEKLKKRYADEYTKRKAARSRR